MSSFPRPFDAAPPAAPRPYDAALVQRIDTLAAYAARNGEAFVDLTRQRQQVGEIEGTVGWAGGGVRAWCG